MKLLYIYVFIVSTLVGLTKSNQCPANYDTSDVLTTRGYIFSNIDTYWIETGYVSDDGQTIYTAAAASILGVDYMIISKLDYEFNEIWSLTLQGIILSQGIIFDEANNQIMGVFYHVLNCKILKIDMDDGTLISAKTLGSVQQCFTVSFSNNYFFVTGLKSLVSSVIVFESSDFSVIGSVSLFTNYISSVYSYFDSNGDLMIFIDSIKDTTEEYQFSVVQFASGIGTQQWAMYLDCFPSCIDWAVPYYSLINTDMNVSMQAMKEDNKLIFFSLNINDGTLVGDIHKVDTGETNILLKDIAFSELYSIAIILIKHDNGFHKIHYDLASDSFTSAYLSTEYEGHYIQIVYDYTYIGGKIIASNEGIISKLVGLGDNSQNQEFVMILASPTYTNSTLNYAVTVDAALFLSNSGYPTVADTPLTEVDEGAYQESTSYIFSSDIVYQEGIYENYYVQELISDSVVFNFPCSISGANAITASLVGYSIPSDYPSWISINPDYEHLDVNTPAYVEADNPYMFIVRINVLGENIDKTVILTLYQCLVPNCDRCDYGNEDQCTICEEDYELSDDASQCIYQEEDDSQSSLKDYDPSEQAKIKIRIGQVLLAASIGLSLISLLAYGSSSHSLWALLNQYQLFLMLPLLDTYLPNDFVYFIREFQFTLFDFAFVSFLKIPWLCDLIDKLDYEQNDEVFKDGGLHSGSHIVNQLGAFRILILIVITNILMLLVYALFNTFCKNTVWKKLKFIISYCFHFAVYIRFLLEAFLFAMLSCVSELFRTSAIASNKGSYVASIFFLVCVCAIVSIPIIYYQRSKKPWESYYLRELFYECKHRLLPQFYYFAFILRRTMIVVMLVSCENLLDQTKIGIFMAIQICFLFYSTLVRPFEETLNNILEIFNDSVFVVANIVTMILSYKSMRYEYLKDSMIYFALVDGLVMCIANLINLWVRARTSCRKRAASRHKNNLSKVVPFRPDFNNKIKNSGKNQNLASNRVPKSSDRRFKPDTQNQTINHSLDTNRALKISDFSGNNRSNGQFV